MSATATCHDCQIEYPDELVVPYFDGQTYTPVCGICALARVNKLHGTQTRRFHGQAADALRLAAIRFRRERIPAKESGT